MIHCRQETGELFLVCIGVEYVRIVACLMICCTHHKHRSFFHNTTWLIFTYYLPHILPPYSVPWNSGVADISCLESVTSIGY